VQPVDVLEYEVQEISNFLDTPRGPWETRPYKLISWWDMEKFGAAQFYCLSKSLADMRNAATQTISEGHSEEMDIGEVGHGYLKELADEAKTDCQKLGLVISAKAAARIMEILKPETTHISRLHKALEQLEDNIEWEMEEKLFFHLPSARAAFYDQQELFGADVNTKFPTIQFDMVEAGNCYSVGRGTATVFHLMRIMEVGVQEFGTKLGVVLADEKNWQNILDEINKAIKSLPPKDPATVAKCQVSANLYAVKLAWRNEVMHPKDTYTLEEAENLIRQVKLFMEQLAVII
jgi:hypothetical protein